MKKTFWAGAYTIGDIHQNPTDQQIRVELNRRQLSITKEKTQETEVWHLDSLMFKVPQPPDGVCYMWLLTKGPDTARVQINTISKWGTKTHGYVAEVRFSNREYYLIDHPVTFLAPPVPTTKIFWVQKYAISSLDWPSIDRGDSMPDYICSRPDFPMSVTLKTDEVTIGVNSVNKETWHLDSLTEVTYRRLEEGIKETRIWHATKQNESSHEKAIIYAVIMDDDRLGYNARLHIFTDIKSKDKWEETLYLLR